MDIKERYKDLDNPPSIIQEMIIYNKPNIRNESGDLGRKLINITSDVVISYKNVKNHDPNNKPETSNTAPSNKLITKVKYEKITASDEDDANDEQQEEQEESLNRISLEEHQIDEMEEEDVDEEQDDLNLEQKQIMTNIKLENETSTPIANDECVPKKRGRPKKMKIVTQEPNANEILLINYIKEKEKEIANSSANTLNIGQTRKSKRNLNSNNNTTQSKNNNNEEKPVKKQNKRKLKEPSKSRKQQNKSVFIKMENIETSGEEDDCNVPEGGTDNETVESKKRKIACKFCFKEFNSYYSMKKHRLLEHDDSVQNEEKNDSNVDYGFHQNEVENNYDDNDMSDSESLGEWMPDDYAQYKIEHKMEKLNKKQRHKCKICCLVFSSYYRLCKHKLQHENTENPYECNECNESFSDIDTFTSHIRIHRGKDPYQCKKCIKGFAHKEELDKHSLTHLFKKKPDPVKRYRCDICFKEFVKLCDIERHSRVHTGEKPCECKICHKKFQQSHNLSKHLLIHLHVKPFQCEICNKKFGRVDVLNRHLLTHSMEKPFKCHNCNRGFIRHVQLTHHLTKCNQLVTMVIP